MGKNNIIDRRRFLVALLGIPASLMGLDEEIQDIQTIKKAEIIFNEDPMSFLEDQMQTRWDMQLIGGPLRASHGLTRWITEIATFTTSMQGTAWNSRALGLLCMSYRLQGSVAGDLMHYKQAHIAYQQASRIAQELEDSELIAAVRVRQAIVFMRQEKILEALSYLNNAFEVIQGTVIHFSKEIFCRFAPKPMLKHSSNKNAGAVLALPKQCYNKKNK